MNEILEINKEDLQLIFGIIMGVLDDEQVQEVKRRIELIKMEKEQ